MLVSQFDNDKILGPTGTGKIYSGKAKVGEPVVIKNLDGTNAGRAKIKSISVVRGEKRVGLTDKEYVLAGDIASFSFQSFVPRWTQTIG